MGPVVAASARDGVILLPCTPVKSTFDRGEAESSHHLSNGR